MHKRFNVLLSLSILSILSGCSGGNEKAAKEQSTEFDDIEFVWIPPGTFLMGSPRDESEWYNEEQQRSVMLTKGFWIGKFEITQKQWESITGENPSYFVGKNNPVESISWDDIKRYLTKLNALGDGQYRLPTEAEWEYACRAGSTKTYGFGSDASKLEDYAWTFWNSNETTHPVGSKKSNAWGLHDMHGNVREWCSDWYAPYSDDNVVDPLGSDSGHERVTRGGSFLSGNDDCRSAHRHLNPTNYWHNSLGFRVVRYN
ncbi:MAG: formylglycine-generating enzyme family protein [Candidatus Hydrogenedentota bacterium]